LHPLDLNDDDLTQFATAEGVEQNDVINAVEKFRGSAIATPPALDASLHILNRHQTHREYAHHITGHDNRIAKIYGSPWESVIRPSSSTCKEC